MKIQKETTIGRAVEPLYGMRRTHNKQFSPGLKIGKSRSRMRRTLGADCEYDDAKWRILGNGVEDSRVRIK